MAEDQSDKCSSCDPAAPVSNGRSGRLKPWPDYLRSLSAAKLIWSCHNNQLGDRHLQLLMEKKKKKRQSLKKKNQQGGKCVLSARTALLHETEKQPEWLTRHIQIDNVHFFLFFFRFSFKWIVYQCAYKTQCDKDSYMFEKAISAVQILSEGSNCNLECIPKKLF